MADVASLPPKKLKQARLSFGKLPKGNKTDHIVNKENLHQGKIKLENCIKSLHKKKFIPNEIVVKADVHQTIQCPEITTSTLQSNSEIIKHGNDEDIIDLTENDLMTMEEDLNNAPTLNDSSNSTSSAKSIDESIDNIIFLAVNNSEELHRRADLARDKKRRRSRSPQPKSPTVSENAQSAKKDKSKVEQEKEKAVDSILEDIEQKPKKPRRSIIDLFNSAQAKKSEPIVGNESRNDECELMEVDADKSDMAKLDGNVDEPVGKSVSNSLTTPAKEATSSEKTVSPITAKKVSPTSSKPRSARKVDLEALKKKEQREKEREEKKKQKEEEKMQKDNEKLNLKRKKEEERLQKEDEKRQKREELERVKEEKLKKKMEELEKKKAELESKRIEREQKEEERKREKEKKEMEKKAKEEEKLRCIQEKLKIEEEKKKMKVKQVSTFKNFFTSPGRAVSIKKVTSDRVGNFVPFQLKENMHLAPSRRRKLTDDDLSHLDLKLGKQDLIIKKVELKKKSNRRKSVSTIPKKKQRALSLFEDGLEFLLDDGSRCSTTSVNNKPRKVKYLHFCQDNRPPYYGTWSKSGCTVKPRQPFYKDIKTFDYEFDSEEEWEEPVEGEDIANSDGEEEGEKDDEDDDDGFFVPHGYLSDDEGIQGEDNDDDEGMETDISEQKLRMKQQEFENNYKQKIKVLTPICVGCVWPTMQNSLRKEHANLLGKYKMKFLIDTPIDLEEPVAPVKLKSNDNALKSENKLKNKWLFPDEAIPDFIRLLHGNPLGTNKIVKEFQSYWELKNLNQLPHGKGPPNLNPQSNLPQTVEAMDSNALDNEISQLTSNLAPNLGNPPKTSPSPVSVSPQTLSATSSPSLVSGVTLTSQDKGPFFISKAQLTKKIKEMGAHGRKETLSRSCWFVLDAVFEKHKLDPSDYPVPYQWGYITDVPNIKLSKIGETVAPQPTQIPLETGVNISKFASKMSAEAILESSSIKMKREKEKENSVPEKLASISKFATTKVKAEDLIERSSQKIEKEKSKAPRRVELTTIATPSGGTNSPYDVMLKEDGDLPPAGNFTVPTHEAFKSFFKLKCDKLMTPSADEDAKTIAAE